MANLDQQNKNNTPGPLYVDTTCIDCETCFHIAPELFIEKNHLSTVQKQPDNIEEWAKAKEAILSCPTTSIGVNQPPADFKKAPMTLPRNIIENIYYCGYTSESSYGASSYLITTPGGNMLIDSPRFNFHLVREIEKLGGVRWMFLTHKDDVADHEKFKEHFNCTRIIHRDDVTADTKNCEAILEGNEDREFTADIRFIMTPGHTRGHMILYYKNKYLFTGDHLFFDNEIQKVYASKNVNWYSWDVQVQSIRKLMQLFVAGIFPGHGGWAFLEKDKFRKDLESLN